MSDDLFETLRGTLATQGPVPLLDQLAEQLAAEQKCHELFDVRLMSERLRLGLPVVLTSTIDELPEPERGQLEEAYLKVCREVGMALLAQQRVREAWPYLRPLGDAALVRKSLAEIEPDEQNLQPLVEILLHEGIDVGRGYQLVLDHYGTCNAISAYEGLVTARPLADRQEAVARLVGRLREELLGSLRADITQHDGQAPVGETVSELIAGRDWLFADNRYHIDTTHLASTVRYARLLEDRVAIEQAWELAEYGRRLSAQFHYSDDEPFVDLYAATALFLAAQLGQRQQEALEFFKARAEEVDGYHQGTLAAEVYVVLLVRLGRLSEAIDAALQHIPPGTHTTGFAPSLMELCQQAGDYRRLLENCRKRGDVVGFAASLIAERG